MAKIGFKNKYEYTILGDGIFILREPTNKEWNKFRHNSMNTKKTNGNIFELDTQSMDDARVDLFNSICVEVVNLEDDDGFITAKTLERIPDRYKTECIMKIFEVGKDNKYIKKN